MTMIMINCLCIVLKKKILGRIGCEPVKPVIDEQHAAEGCVDGPGAVALLVGARAGAHPGIHAATALAANAGSLQEMEQLATYTAVSEHTKGDFGAVPIVCTDGVRASVLIVHLLPTRSGALLPPEQHTVLPREQELVQYVTGVSPIPGLVHHFRGRGTHLLRGTQA